MSSVVDTLPIFVSRLSSIFGANRTIYADGVPAGILPDNYVLVRASTGEASSDNVAFSTDRRAPVIYVTCVSQAPSDAQAIKQAGWASRVAVDALTDWRPSIGRAAHLIEHIASLPPTRDESLPNPVAYTVDQFIPRYQP